MFVTVIIMLIGVAISFYGLEKHSTEAVWIGLVTIIIICASWWLWVMFVIRTIIESNNRTHLGIKEIKDKISEVKLFLSR